jgi:hypothetical protein
MTIVDGEEGTFWPFIWVFILWPRHIEDDGDSILIVVPLDTLMSIGGVARNEAMRLGCIFSIFKILKGIKCLLVAIRVDKEAMALDHPFELCFNYTIGAVLLAVGHLSFNLLDHRVKFPIDIGQRLL